MARRHGLTRHSSHRRPSSSSVPAPGPRADAPAAPTRREAFFYWLRLGCVSFGGPAGQIALMHHDLVVTRRWISERRFLHALNYCMLLPGPEAQQLATYIGWLLHRTWGGIIAGTLFVLPSLVLLIGLSWVYIAWGNLPAVAGVLQGIKPAVIAMVFHAAWRIGTRVLTHPSLWLVAVAAWVASALLAVPFPAIVLSAALLGHFAGRLWPAAFTRPAPTVAAQRARAPAVIDDETAPPAHARFRLRRVVATIAACGSLWLAAIAMLAAFADRQGVLPQLALFFTKAALLTFGGAYAVLPYVYQAAVDDYGWLTASQMIDGLALGETTPGPLIMIVAFVGFVAGWTRELFGASALPLAGVAGALVATFFTFLPSFLFILAGAPLIEATHGQQRLTAPLSAITAAVVGVIVNLAGYLAYRVIWPGGAVGGLAAVDGFAVSLVALAAVALFRFRAGAVPVIAGCALAGLARALLLPP